MIASTWPEERARLEKTKNVYRILLRKLLRKQPLGRQRRGEDNNIKVNLRKICCEDVNWTESSGLLCLTVDFGVNGIYFLGSISINTESIHFPHPENMWHVLK